MSVDVHDIASATQARTTFDRFMTLDTQVWTAQTTHNQARAAQLALGPESVAYNALAKAAEGYAAQAQELARPRRRSAT